MKIRLIVLFTFLACISLAQVQRNNKKNVGLVADYGIYQSGLVAQFKVFYAVKSVHRIYTGIALNHLYSNSNSFFAGPILGYEWKIPSAKFDRLAFLAGAEARFLFGRNTNVFEGFVQSGLSVKIVKGFHFYPKLSFGVLSTISQNVFTRLNGGFSIGFGYEF